MFSRKNYFLLFLFKLIKSNCSHLLLILRSYLFFS